MENDRERMRRVLAEKGMGWYMAASGRWWTDDVVWQRISEWRPDVMWSQCGLVIEAMREKGWRCQIETWLTFGVTARFICHDATGGFASGQETISQAVALAAYQALETTDAK